MDRGEFIASGRTSDVFAFGDDRVIKVLRPEVPDEWAELEAHMTSVVRSHGLPVPEVHGVVMSEGRPGIVFERIVGPSMWQKMLAAPDAAPDLANQLALVQRQIQSAGIPVGVPDLVDRVRNKLTGVEQLRATERQEACVLLDALPRGAALLHGDLHPGNVLMGPDGAVVIDWFDAAIGHPVADVVRSSILMRYPTNGVELAHLPGATEGLLALAHRSYVEAFASELGRDAAQLCAWEAVVAAGRLVEGAQPDETTLVALWQDRRAGRPSAALTG